MSRRALRALNLALPPGWRAWEAHGWIYAVGANLASYPGALMTMASQSAPALLKAVAAEIARQEHAVLSPFERSAA